MGDFHTMTLYGHTKIWKNDELIFDKRNQITDTLRQYLKDRMDSDQATEAVDGDDDITRFEDGDIVGDDNSIQGRAGIIVTDTVVAGSADRFRTLATTQINSDASNTYGRKWRGFLQAGGPRTFNEANLVFNWDWDNNAPFGSTANTKRYARQTFSRVTLAQSDTLTIEWEVYVA